MLFRSRFKFWNNRRFMVVEPDKRGMGNVFKGSARMLRRRLRIDHAGFWVDPT